ncbi:aminoglycoside phosphotransferase family protein [Jiangella asiatica]|uniref:Aminoglycoside phosphotransferase family protein n=1 Tax=Jiangella asiatica TaxID=2530372 RepID=A0A4V2YZ19_9ACTN|nr:aminoglycoside phosphotransferase family protein [Jiangella asiatica]TDD95287.1 aminoglycoside phosphotransferase family protein [Jiangella asiatica]
MNESGDSATGPVETPLPGGNVGGARRVGDTVRRPTGPWTPAVHALLGHLRRSGLDSIPTVLGIDEQGREILTFLPGRSIEADTDQVSDALLADGVRWLRRFHDAVRAFRPDGEVQWRHGRRALGDGEIVCHNDPGAYNWIVDGDRVVGVIDWDMAGPGLPVDDLAFVAWKSLPLHRELPPDVVAARLRLMAEAYGDVTPARILARVERRMGRAADSIDAGQRRGDPGLLNLASIGEPGRTRAALAALRDRLPAITAALETPPAR